MRAWLERHRPGPAAGAALGAALFIGLAQLLPLLSCG